MNIFLTEAETALVLEVSRRTVQRLVQRGELTRYGKPKQPAYRRDEVLALADRRQPGSERQAWHNLAAALTRRDKT